MKDRQIRTYLLWAFAIAWAIQGLAVWFARQGQAAAFQLALMVTMYAPFAAVLLARIPLRGMGWTPKLRGKWRWFFAAWLGPAVLCILGAVLYYVVFPGRLDLNYSAYTAQLGEEGLALLAADGVSVQTLILSQLVSALTWGPFVNMLAALGEEVGWRGALYPRLKERFGVGRGRLLGGLIWGVWHWPVMILAGYNYGLRYWGAPILGPLLFCLITTALGILIDLLYNKTNCIWIPALAHGAVNAVGSAGVLVLNAAYADQTILGPSMLGAIGGLPLLVLAAVLWQKGGEPERSGEETPA